ncbi:LacI family transcriptional regulator [Flavobacteriaceae bacterium]|nr:LacI family transcriptional regulator [Flavobacteriaceae bacterium]MDB2685228.1 LacI family transcriptional regulator [Flavobacteriaceae bacterium]MDC0331857.1 LacI family transcriptional regulator [Flavobacteriaceae bacterium]
MKKNITIKELSKILEVSISTVSKALNDSYEISDSTKERIKAAAKTYNYKPNKLAVNLKSGKTNTIGVVLPSIKNFFMSRVLRGIDSVIAKSKYNIIISITNESFDKEVQSVQTLSNGLVDAIIIAVSEETQIKKDFSHLSNLVGDIPLLMVDRIVNSINCDKVLVDDYNAIFNAVSDLIFEGKKSIALVSSINNLNVGKLRTKGYLAAIQNKQEPIVLEGQEGYIESELSKLIESNKIDAIMALDQESSLAAFRIGKVKKVLNNKEVSIIGYASRVISEHLTPKLTTIDQHGKKVGVTSAKLLLKRLDSSESEPESIIVNSTVQKRFTT